MCDHALVPSRPYGDVAVSARGPLLPEKRANQTKSGSSVPRPIRSVPFPASDPTPAPALAPEGVALAALGPEGVALVANSTGAPIRWSDPLPTPAPALAPEGVALAALAPEGVALVARWHQHQRQPQCLPTAAAAWTAGPPVAGREMRSARRWSRMRRILQRARARRGRHHRQSSRSRSTRNPSSWRLWRVWLWRTCWG